MRYTWLDLLHRAELAEFMAELMPNARCVAVYEDRDNQPCSNAPVPGLDKCWYHAGTTRDEELLERGLQRATEARAMLSEAAPAAAVRLAHIALRAGKDRDAITAASQVLDRVGVGSKSAIDVNLSGSVTHVDATPALNTLLERLDMIEKRRAAIPADSVLAQTKVLVDKVAAPPIPPPPARAERSAEAG